MRVEDCIVTVERRTLGGCVDLAFVFTRELAGPLFRIWLACAVPCLLIVWLLTSRQTLQLVPCILVTLFFTGVFSSLLVSCMGPQVFGVPISLRMAARTWRKRFWAWLLLTGVMRFFQAISGFCFVLPSAFVTAFAAYLPEVLFLEQAPASTVTTRLNWLAGGGGYSRSLARSFTLTVGWGVVSLSLFILIDLVSSWLLNVPILFSRVSYRSDEIAVRIGEAYDAWFQMVGDDPRVAVATQLAIWLPYPVIRLAWFFCYLDQRIRNECWDLQLQCRIEAARLEDTQ